MLTATVLLTDCCCCCCARRTRSRTLSEAAVSSRDRIGSTSGHGPSGANSSSGNSRADNNSSSSRDGKKPKGKRRKRRQLKVSIVLIPTIYCVSRQYVLVSVVSLLFTAVVPYCL
jgi:hypothetical protein